METFLWKARPADTFLPERWRARASQTDLDVFHHEGLLGARLGAGDGEGSGKAGGGGGEVSGGGGEAGGGGVAGREFH